MYNTSNEGKRSFLSRKQLESLTWLELTTAQLPVSSLPTAQCCPSKFDFPYIITLESELGTNNAMTEFKLTADRLPNTSCMH